SGLAPFGSKHTPHGGESASERFQPARHLGRLARSRVGPEDPRGRLDRFGRRRGRLGSCHQGGDFGAQGLEGPKRLARRRRGRRRGRGGGGAGGGGGGAAWGAGIRGGIWARGVGRGRAGWGGGAGGGGAAGGGLGLLGGGGAGRGVCSGGGGGGGGGATAAAS